jgi:hypothetical protein
MLSEKEIRTGSEESEAEEPFPAPVAAPAVVATAKTAIRLHTLMQNLTHIDFRFQAGTPVPLATGDLASGLAN